MNALCLMFERKMLTPQKTLQKQPQIVILPLTNVNSICEPGN